MFHGRPWECCHISPKGGGKEQKEQSKSHWKSRSTQNVSFLWWPEPQTKCCDEKGCFIIFFKPTLAVWILNPMIDILINLKSRFVSLCSRVGSLLCLTNQICRVLQVTDFFTFTLCKEKRNSRFFCISLYLVHKLHRLNLWILQKFNCKKTLQKYTENWLDWFF